MAEPTPGDFPRGVVDPLRLAAIGLTDTVGGVPWDVVHGVGERLATSTSPAGHREVPSILSAEEATVLGSFLEGTRLVSIPSVHTNRIVVLDDLVQRFDVGVRFSEPDSNVQLQLVSADYVAFRRYLDDEEFMTRAEGVYWRTRDRHVTGRSVDE